VKREHVITDDGSSSIYLPELNERYHSSHGAIQEAMHVFINNGLELVEGPIRIFELGFGTGLNALLTLKYAKDKIVYHTIEAYPVENSLVEKLNYSSIIGSDLDMQFRQMHSAKWSQNIQITDNFIFQKIEKKMESYSMMNDYYDVIFFDAFGPRVQEQLWKKEILLKMYHSLVKGGTLVTYCAQGQFKRDLKSVGFDVEVLPGPPGKREMTRGVKR